MDTDTDHWLNDDAVSETSYTSSKTHLNGKEEAISFPASRKFYEDTQDKHVAPEDRITIARASTPDIFDNILSIEADYISQGRKEGALFGLEKGRLDGEQLGYRYGASYGEEIGFYIGFTNAWLSMMLMQQWDIFVSGSAAQLPGLADIDTNENTTPTPEKMVTSLQPADFLSYLSLSSLKTDDTSTLPPLSPNAPPYYCLFYSQLVNMPLRNRRALLSLLWLQEHLRDIPMDAADEQGMDKVETVRARFRAFASRMGLTTALGLSQKDTIGF